MPRWDLPELRVDRPGVGMLAHPLSAYPDPAEAMRIYETLLPWFDDETITWYIHPGKSVEHSVEPAVEHPPASL